MFNTLITGPFGSILAFIYSLVKNYGLAIIVFTIVCKMLLFPFTLKSKRGMYANMRLQPKMQELQKKYKNDKERYSLELQKLYKEEKASPTAGCLPMLITLPIMFGLYYVVTQPLTYLMKLSKETVAAIAGNLSTILQGHGIEGTIIENLTKLADGEKVYSLEVTMADYMAKYSSELQALMPDLPEKVFDFKFDFLGINLSNTPTYNISDPNFNWGLLIIVIISVGTAFLSGWINQKMNPMNAQANQNDPAAKSTQSTNKMMLYMMPVMTLLISFSIPAAVSIYWIMNNILGVVQEYLANKIVKRQEDAAALKRAEDEERKKRNKKKAAELEAREKAAENPTAED
ncbi:MAG: membrane protein insertase YidC [Clostridia bacterium]|nr:membrane protein insertase YidC [Clostridia bacterium]